MGNLSIDGRMTLKWDLKETGHDDVESTNLIQDRDWW
jgi:hypothetical protein